MKDKNSEMQNKSEIPYDATKTKKKRLKNKNCQTDLTQNKINSFQFLYIYRIMS